MSKNNKSVEDVVADMKRYATCLSREMAQEAKERLTQEAEEAIEMFYGTYEPEYYKRHTPLMANVKRSFRPYYYSPHGNNSRGGVQIDASWMNDIYQHEPEIVAMNVWAGYHGPPIGHNYKTPYMLPSPIEMVINMKDYLVNHIDIIQSPAEKRVLAKNKFNSLFK